VAFASAVAGTDQAALDTARSQLRDVLGAPAVVTASIIAANFSMLDRAANGVGISVDSMIVEPTADFRSELGINEYTSAANTLG
jgi:hypothetical protein